MHACAFCALACVMFAAAASAWTDVQGVVVGVSDGDTITVLDDARAQHKVRLSGIDAPEKGQAFGTRAKESLSDCAFGYRAHVVGDKVDRYGRLVGKVVVEEMDCNMRQVEVGLAWHYKHYQREQSPQDRLAYAQAQGPNRVVAAGRPGASVGIQASQTLAAVDPCS